MQPGKVGSRREHFGVAHYPDFGGAASLKCEPKVAVLLRSFIAVYESQ
jgi:hypothetical protein